MTAHLSTFEWRQYGHWATDARKARFAAFVLWHMADAGRIGSLIEACKYDNGDASHALTMAFKRESAIALELIVKAVIARRLEIQGADPSDRKGRVPATHDLPKLWKQANLPELPREDSYRLLLFKSILMWSGRYATPKSDEAWQNENEEFQKLEDPPHDPNKFIFRKPVTFGWMEFDHLFQMAEAALVSKSRNP